MCITICVSVQCTVVGLYACKYAVACLEILKEGCPGGTFQVCIFQCSNFSIHFLETLKIGAKKFHLQSRGTGATPPH